MGRHGFEPVSQRRGSQADIVLGACPFETTALADPDTVCGLHLGLALGAADALGGLVIDELVRRDRAPRDMPAPFSRRTMIHEKIYRTEN